MKLFFKSHTLVDIKKSGGTCHIWTLATIKMRASLLIFTMLHLTTNILGQNDLKRIKDLKIGLITGSTIVIQNGLISSESSQNFINLFNEAGQVIETRTANIDNGNAIIYKFKYGKCDEHDRWEWLNWRKSDGKIDTVQIQLMTFDKNCRTKTVVWLDSTGIQTDTRVFEYDNNGKKTSEIDLNIKNEKTAFILYSYADNYTIDKKAFFGDSTFWYHNREYFDKKGNQIGYDSFDENGNKTNEGEKVNFIYKDDRPIEETHYESNGQIRSKTNYLYNAEGLVERTITKSRSGDDETEIISILKYIKRY